MIRAETLKIRQRPSDATALERVQHLSRVLYNAALEQRREAYRKQGKSLSFYDQCKDLTLLRAEDERYAALSVDMLRLTALHRLDKAYKAFFRRVKRGEKPGFPRFKSRDRFDTLVFGTTGWKITCGKLRLQGIGTFLLAGKMHRDGKPMGLRLVRTARGWYVHVLLDVGDAPAVKAPTSGGANVGIDVGLTTFATMSDGSTVEHPRFLRHATEAITAASRSLASKKRGSNRRRKAKAELQRLHQRVADRRKNFCWQAASQISKRYDGFAVEDLDIKQMVEKKEGDGKRERGLRRGIMDAAWGQFAHALACKAEEAGKPFVRVNPRGTSQRCSACGTVVKKTLRDRVHACHCGLVMDRDLNAAKNIYDLGWRSAGCEPAESLA